MENTEKKEGFIERTIDRLKSVIRKITKKENIKKLCIVAVAGLLSMK